MVKQNRSIKKLLLKHLSSRLVIVVPLFSSGFSNHGSEPADELRVAGTGREIAFAAH
jgi:hypothetical protein